LALSGGVAGLKKVMALGIPKRQFTSKVVGRTIRDAICEKCGANYVYALSCEAEATAETSLAEPAEKAEQQATEDATSQLSAKLAHDVAPVPCPRCGWLQADMVKRLRDDLGSVADAVAAIAIFFGIVVLLILGIVWLATWQDNDGSADITLRRVALCSVAAAVCGFIVLGINAWRRRCWDPNLVDRRQQILFARESAALKEDLDDARQAALLAAADKRQLHRLNRSHQSDEYFKAAVTLACGGIMAYFLASEMPLVVAAARTFSWSDTKGVVQSAVVASERRGKDRYYWPEVDYSYTADGRNYRGRRYYLVPDDSIRVSAPSRITEELARHRDVVVYYDPHAPGESVLIRGLPFWKAFFVMAFSAATGGALILAWRFIRAAHRPLLLNFDDPAPEKPSTSPAVQRFTAAAAAVIIFVGGIIGPMVMMTLPGLDRAAEQRRQETEQRKQLATQLKAEMDEHWKRAAVVQEVEALVAKYDLSADEFENILRSEWAATHPEGQRKPWRIRVGDNPYFWRFQVDWDVEAVRKRCQEAEAARARDAANDH
jgi:hypothetical protein